MKSFSGAWAVSGGFSDAGSSSALLGIEAFHAQFDKKSTPALKNLSVSIARGTVNGYEPILNGSPISGVGADGKMRSGGPPCLSDDAKFDKYGRCYVCIKIKVDPKTGKMKLPPTEDDLTVKITDKPRLGESDKYWLHPIAIFTKDGRMGQVAYFDYLHYTSRHPANLLEGPTGDFKFHYFCVA